MARKREKRRRDDEHTFLGIRVEAHTVRAEASINLDARMDRPLFARDDDLLFESHTRLRISGTATHPTGRAGEPYEIEIRGDASSRRMVTLKDVHAHDEQHAPIYKTRRGERYPVYDAPPGIATMARRRGTGIWDAWITVAPSLVSDMLALLAQTRPLYLYIHERKADRQRWIVSIALQTTDPAEE